MRGTSRSGSRRRGCAYGMGLVLVALSLVFMGGLMAGCGGEGTDTTAAPATQSSTTEMSTSTTADAACSAVLLDLELQPQEGLPQVVTTTRERVFAAAMSCDYAQLEKLASAGPKEFSFSFGNPAGGPAAFWREAEERGEPVMAWLANVLTMPYGRVGEQYVWPFAHALDFAQLTVEQEALLREHFSESDTAAWKQAGGYMGYRVGIDPDGEWLFLVAGD